MACALETLTLEQAQVTCLPEMVTRWPRTALFGKVDAHAFRSAAAAAADIGDDGTILLSFNIYLVQVSGAVVLIDAGVGQGKDRPDRPAWHMRDSALPQMLEASGVRAGQVDIVLNTHFHADHVGWNTVADASGRWVPAFPNARYLAPAIELDDLQQRRAALVIQGGDENGLLHGAFKDSLRPILDGPGFTAVHPDDEILPGLRLVPLPGHTRGQVGAVLEAGSEKVLFCADAIHHPAQLADASIGSNFCADPDTAQQTRRELLEQAAHAGTILAPYHFPAPSFGRVIRRDCGFAYSPIRTT